MNQAAIYCRVSTDNQESEGTSLKTQLEACLDYCISKQYQVAYQFSEAYSGLTLDRPSLNELMDHVKDDSIDIIVTYCLDRLSRDPTHGVILMQEFEKHNVILEAVTENIDSSEIGRLINYIRGFASKLEAEKIKERTMRGKRARLKEGRLPQGTGVGIYGYDWDEETKKRVINKSEAMVVRRISDMAIDGCSCFHIARELNREGILTKTGKQWHPLTIRRLVMNPAYYGETIFNQTRRIGTRTEKRPGSEWVILHDVTPPIISQELFNRAQRKLSERQSVPGRALVEYLLRGHVYCPACGSKITGTMLNRKYRYYRCAGTKPTSSRTTICREPYIKADSLEQVVWDTVSEAIKNPEVMIAALREQIEGQKDGLAKETDIDIEIKKLSKRIKAYDKQQKRLVRLFKLGAIDEDTMLNEMNQVKIDRNTLQERLAELENCKKALQGLQHAEVKVNDFCEALRHQIDCSSNETKRLALDALAVKVYATRDSIEIQGIIPVDLVTIEQTSGCLFRCRYTYTTDKGYALSRA
ncbi:recombinase family protein [Chloroflexota bacterium]